MKPSLRVSLVILGGLVLAWATPRVTQDAWWSIIVFIGLMLLVLPQFTHLMVLESHDSRIVLPLLDEASKWQTIEPQESKCPKCQELMVWKSQRLMCPLCGHQV